MGSLFAGTFFNRSVWQVLEEGDSRAIDLHTGNGESRKGGEERHLLSIVKIFARHLLIYDLKGVEKRANTLTNVSRGLREKLTIVFAIRAHT